MILEQKMTAAREHLALLRREPKTIPPGKYRVYFPPEAWQEMLYLVCMGFSLRMNRTKTTPLLRMITDGVTLSEKVTLRDHPAACMTPRWAGGGFLRPERLTLMEAGRIVNTMASPRTAKEYGVETTGSEFPSAVSMDGGDVPADRALAELGTGLIVNQLWYVNYSDRSGGRLTGMTRFATFWVEDGRLVAPVNVMRFDETLYHFLGDHLAGVTDTPMLLPTSSTYGRRATGAVRMPGIIVDDFTFTL
jgi:predicted Zn-dependent protease